MAQSIHKGLSHLFGGLLVIQFFLAGLGVFTTVHDKKFKDSNFNSHAAVGDLMLVLGVSLITSKGAHGVPGSAIVILAATLNAVPSIPAIGLVLVLSVDWFIGMARALGNLIGNCVATVVVAAWEGDLDRAKATRVLDGEELVDVTAG